ncbi:MAG: hypothetical protein KDN19_09175 [Verrucomicrobiae bacterium]|nr:hypothetical protein [Verrucomicrobiae bacterium]
MSEHPGDSATNRFRAFWAGMLAFVSFGVVLWIALKIASPDAPAEPGWAQRAEERSQKVAEVRAAQAALLAPEAIQKAMPTTLASLKAKKAGKSEFVVPGSPTFLKQAQQPAPAAPAEEAKPDAAQKPAAAEKPAAAPAEKPAAEKKPAEAPAAAKPEKPAGQ